MSFGMKEDRIHVRMEIAKRHFPRRGYVSVCTHVLINVDDADRPSRYLRHRRETAELAWEPEPDTAFIRNGALWREHSEPNGQQRRSA